jgi:putative glutamine amidotransferase
MIKTGILGRQGFTLNYEIFASGLPSEPVVTLNPEDIYDCNLLILPGGGDISPAFYGEVNHSSVNIDTELDILQFQALQNAIRAHIPVIGICKGMQLINVAFGGTLVQDMPTSDIHKYDGIGKKDRRHDSVIKKDSCLYKLYGQKMQVNSAHHQCVGRLGTGLRAIQWCPQDDCIEAIVHEYLPILGLQWHPERLSACPFAYDAASLPSLLCSLICVSEAEYISPSSHSPFFPCEV